MEWLEGIPALPLGGSVGAFVALLTWLVKRGDGVTRSNVAELRRQRDEAIAREEALRSVVDQVRGELREREDELHEYRRRHGPLNQPETEP